MARFKHNTQAHHLALVIVLGPRFLVWFPLGKLSLCFRLPPLFLPSAVGLRVARGGYHAQALAVRCVVFAPVLIYLISRAYVVIQVYGLARSHMYCFV
jgi:putative effector of murein hydrolase LrgA (UPF0299 family)